MNIYCRVFPGGAGPLATARGAFAAAGPVVETASGKLRGTVRVRIGEPIPTHGHTLKDRGRLTERARE
jgi:hypothetical protein